ncbi:hypothetical protein B7494_g3825 [Chlorociboria aeruginascens]|nr:hypothetical protein B7494_g3825 [Chlorociboria aeruginascens]
MGISHGHRAYTVLVAFAAMICEARQGHRVECGSVPCIGGVGEKCGKVQPVLAAVRVFQYSSPPLSSWQAKSRGDNGLSRTCGTTYTVRVLGVCLSLYLNGRAGSHHLSFLQIKVSPDASKPSVPSPLPVEAPLPEKINATRQVHRGTCFTARHRGNSGDSRVPCFKCRRGGHEGYRHPCRCLSYKDQQPPHRPNARLLPTLGQLTSNGSHVEETQYQEMPEPTASQ